MNSFKYNQIENKIRQFKEGVDYFFEGEKVTSDKIRTTTTHTYQIKSPQLNQIIQNYLQQQNAILMSLDFKGRDYTFESTRPDNSGKDWNENYNAIVSDENGNTLYYGLVGQKEENKLGFSIRYWNEPGAEEKEFSKKYQSAKQVWEAKGSPLNNIPPTGVKCGSCYEVISDADIAAGRYLVESNRFGITQSNQLRIFKTFEHVKEHGCKPKKNDVAQRNNYGYHGELIDEWLKTWPQKKHEISCQDCLTRMWHSVNGNLFYLETWDSEQEHEIGLAKQVLAEIKARLGVLEKTGEYHNCGIKKYCAEHDKPDHSKPKSINDNKGLITAGPVKKDFSEPEKPVFDRQEILNWMKEKGIVEISIDPSNRDNLLIKYANGKVNNLEIANDLPQEWGDFLKREASSSPISLNTQNSPTKNNDKLGVGVIAAFSLLAVGLVAVVGILIYRHQQLKRE